MICRCVLAIMMGVLFSTRATAALLPIENFIHAGPTEHITVPHTLSGGVTSTNSYTGLVEVTVSGVGTNNTRILDAFYQINANPPILYANGLRLGTEVLIETIPPPNSVFSPNDARQVEAGAIHAAELAVAYEGSAFWVTDPDLLKTNTAYAPVYSPNNEYRFVVDLGGYSGHLTPGIGDGALFDNSGSYDVTLTPVAYAAPVPEPSTYAMGLLGLFAVCFIGWRRGRRESHSGPSKRASRYRVPLITVGIALFLSIATGGARLHSPSLQTRHTTQLPETPITS